MALTGLTPGSQAVATSTGLHEIGWVASTEPPRGAGTTYFNMEPGPSAHSFASTMSSGTLGNNDAQMMRNDENGRSGDNLNIGNLGSAGTVEDGGSTISISANPGHAEGVSRGHGAALRPWLSLMHHPRDDIAGGGITSDTAAPTGGTGMRHPNGGRVIEPVFPGRDLGHQYGH